MDADFLLLNPLFAVMKRWKRVEIDAQDCEGITLPRYFYVKHGDAEFMNAVALRDTEFSDDEDDNDSDYMEFEDDAEEQTDEVAGEGEVAEIDGYAASETSTFPGEIATSGLGRLI